LLGVPLSACGEEENQAGTVPEPENPAVEPRNGNVVELDGIRSRVVLSRQLNVRTPRGAVLYEAPLPGGKRGLFAAFLDVCNVSQSTTTPTGRIELQDAFGQDFDPVETYAYRTRPLEPGECRKPPNSTAERTFDGAAVLFTVPFDDVSNRPLVLEFGGDADGDGGRSAVRLDL
jgi:hypothetical protein